MQTHHKTMADAEPKLMYQLLILLTSVLLISTTLLNIAFSLAPQTMTALLLGLLR